MFTASSRGLPVGLQLKNGSKYYEDSNSYSGRIVNVNGTGYNISFSGDDYYNFLKENDLKIPAHLLKEGDEGYIGKEFDTMKLCLTYELKNGDVFKISNDCIKFHPCLHMTKLNEQSSCLMSGEKIYEILLQNGIKNAHFEYSPYS